MAVKKPAPKAPAKKAARAEAATAAPTKKRPVTSKAKAVSGKSDRTAITPQTPRLQSGTAPSNEKTSAQIPETTLLPHNMIRPSKLNPRKTVREGYIEELAESLKATGQLQNISVRMHLPAPGQKGETWYEIIYGEQRWQAFRLLIERGDLPADHPMLCRVMWVDDGQHLELAILENQAREDVHPLEQAEAYARLAKIRAEETGDDKTATRMIADRTGQHIRNVQFYLQVAANLSDEAKAAWREGRIRNRKIAIELARWPHDIQNDAIESGEVDDESDPLRLRHWLQHDAPPVTAAMFSLEDYVAAGGAIVPGEDDEPDRLADKGLAGRLQRQWAEAEAARITEAKGYGLKPAIAESSWDVDRHPWAKPAKGTSKAIQGVRYHINPYTLELMLKHPLCHVQKAQGAAIEAALADRDGETPIEDLPQPYGRRNWINGAAARTRYLRAQLALADPRCAMAVALMSLLENDGWTYPLCALRWQYPSGDAAEVGRIAGPGYSMARAKLAHRPGFNEEGEIDSDMPGVALRTLLDMTIEELLQIFAELVADHCIDADATIQPGIMEETLTLADCWGKAHGDELYNLCTAEWLKAYTVPQILALAEESGAADAMRAAGKPLTANKSYLVSTLPEYIPQGYMPPEARFLQKAEAEQAVAAMLARKAPAGGAP